MLETAESGPTKSAGSRCSRDDIVDSMLIAEDLLLLLTDDESGKPAVSGPESMPPSPARSSSSSPS